MTYRTYWKSNIEAIVKRRFITPLKRKRTAQIHYYFYCCSTIQNYLIKRYTGNSGHMGYLSRIQTASKILQILILPVQKVKLLLVGFRTIMHLPQPN